MMLDASASMMQISLRPLPHVRVADTTEMQTKFYNFEGLLGRGTFGTVMKAKEVKSGSKWAIKVINKAQSGSSRLKLFEREICILRAVHHPHIIHLERVLESPKMLFLVFELCLGELRELFLKKKVFSEDEVRKVVSSLASAVSYLHSNDIVHRDLKLENILVSTNPNDPEDNLFIKVTDFGLSVFRGGVGQESMLQEMCGTPAYMSPELFGERMYSQQCDVWAMGVIMYLLLTGKYPFEGHGGRSLAQVVVGSEPNFNCEPFISAAKAGASTAASESQPKQEESGSRKLLRKMLEKNPAYRATAREVENDPWTRGSDAAAEPATKNAMELMKLWRTEMHDSGGALESESRRQSIRRLSYMLDVVRTSARVSDERARNAAIRRTFGELSPSGSVTMLMPPRARRSSGDSVPVDETVAEAMAAKARTAAPPAGRRLSSITSDAPARNTSRRRSLGGIGRSPRLSVVDEPELLKNGGPAPGPPGQFGVVGRERTGQASDTISTANLMPADRAPPIVYYNRSNVGSNTGARATLEVEAMLQAKMEREHKHSSKHRVGGRVGSTASAGPGARARGRASAGAPSESVTNSGAGAVRRTKPTSPQKPTLSGNIQLKARARANIKVDASLQRSLSASGRKTMERK